MKRGLQITTKLSSRKFIVFVIASLILAAAFVYAYITHETALAEKSLVVWAFVAVVYLGANVVQKIFTNTDIIGAIKGLKGE